MSRLRRRFMEDMPLAGLTDKTIKDYVGAVRRVSKFYLRSPDKISAEELRSWLAHLMVDLDESSVTISYIDRNDSGKRKEKTLEPEEFLGRFMSHVLPTGFHRIRYYGILNNKLQVPRNLSRTIVDYCLSA